MICHFFIDLDHYLTDHPDLPRLHHRILALYSDGYYLTEIAPKVRRSVPRIKQIIARYKQIILAIPSAQG